MGREGRREGARTDRRGGERQRGGRKERKGKREKKEERKESRQKGRNEEEGGSKAEKKPEVLTLASMLTSHHGAAATV